MNQYEIIIALISGIGLVLALLKIYKSSVTTASLNTADITELKKEFTEFKADYELKLTKLKMEIAKVSEKNDIAHIKLDDKISKIWVDVAYMRGKFE